MTFPYDGRLLINKYKVTFWSFIFLLLIRLIDGIKPVSTWGNAASIYSYFYLLVTFALLTFLIWLNKENLSNLNIDKYFIYIFILTGTFLFLFSGLSLLGGIALICVITITRLLLTHRLQFEDKQNFISLIAFIVLGLIPPLLLRLLPHEPSFYIQALSTLSGNEIIWLIVKQSWGVVYEEMLFRGLLWMFLRQWKLSNIATIFTQAFLFWIAHINLTSGLSFWVILPMFSFWYGFLVLRSKSLMPSAVSHFVYNFLVVLTKINL